MSVSIYFLIFVVHRVSIQDFDECAFTEHNDCSDQAICQNDEGSYTCECKAGYHDLSGGDDLKGRVCSGERAKKNRRLSK